MYSFLMLPDGSMVRVRNEDDAREAREIAWDELGDMRRSDEYVGPQAGAMNWEDPTADAVCG
jgi:hypothetical protein